MPRPFRRSRLALRLLRDDRGATALEFGMVAAPMIFMILATLELGLVYMVTTSLDNATQEAARQIRTGELAMAGGATATTFRNQICANMGWLQSQCQANLSVDVRSFPSFSGESAPNPVTKGSGSTNGAFDNSKLTFQTGNAGDIMLVRAFYQWKLITPVLYGGLQSMNNTGVNVITSATTFRNEPYSSGT